MFKKLVFSYMMLLCVSSDVVGILTDLPRENRIAVLAKLYTYLAKQNPKGADKDKMLVLLGLMQQSLAKHKTG